MINTDQCKTCINLEYNQFGPYCYIIYPLPQGDENGVCNCYEPISKYSQMRESEDGSHVQALVDDLKRILCNRQD